MGKRQTDNSGEASSPEKKKKLLDKPNSKTTFKSKNITDKKPDWMKFKEKKKELKVERKKQRCLYTTGLHAKQLWEKYRQKVCEASVKVELGNKLHSLLKGHYQQAVLSHDLGRIIQWLIKQGNIEIQQDIAKELHSNYVEICKSKYGSYTVRKLLKSGIRKIKNEIIGSLMGHIVKLMSHKIAAPVVSDSYELYSNAVQRCCLKQEFYGDMFRLSKDHNVKNLKMALDPCENLKKAILGSTKANLMKVISKNLVNSALVNDVIAEFIPLCEEVDRTDIISAIKGFLPQMVKTKEGAKVGRVCLWYGMQKERKVLVKCLKGSVSEIAMSEHGSSVLMAMFDCVDDTVLVQKAILTEIVSNILEIAKNKNGRKVVLYLVAPRDPLYFHPSIVQLLSEGDSNPYSKKLSDLRRKELLDYILNPLLLSVAENIDEWVADNSIALVTLAILKAGTGENAKAAFSALTKYVCSNGIADETESESCSVVESPGLHFLIKKLILFDKSRCEGNEGSFSEVFVNVLDISAVNQLIQSNRGCFLLVMLLESDIEQCVKTVKSLMTEDVRKTLKKKSFKGSEILQMKLEDRIAAEA
ncbi:hypothetical protein J437_LFUL016632, partial [Ladona fulva]